MLALGRRKQSFRASELAALETLLPTLCLCDAAGGRHALPASLTPREREVLDYLCLGYTNREIALACGSSPHTVRNQLRSIFRKLGASTRAEAVALALGAP
jgi:DNA-binding CsgD family transcriptional regulator